MKRRDFIRLSLLAGTGFFIAGCKNKATAQSADDYVYYLEADVDKTITLEGKILHVCPIEHLKIKLRLDDGEIIRVFNADKSPFDKEWNGKTVRVKGKLEKMDIPRETINKNYKEKKLLCHIDHTPCIDEKWIQNRWKDNSAEDMLERDNKKLQKKLRDTKRNYVQVFTIQSEHIEEI